MTQTPLVPEVPVAWQNSAAAADAPESYEDQTVEDPNDRDAAVVRTLHVINGEDYSGAERVQDLLALRLPEFGYEVAFACVKPDRFAAARQAQSAPLYETPMRAKVDLRPARTLARIIRGEGYEIVHAHSPRAALVGSLAARMAKVPFVHHVHGQTAVDTIPRWARRANTITERVSLAGAAAVIAVSESAAQYMQQQGVPKDLIRLVPNGVPSPDALPDRPEPRTPWVIGTVAMFRPRKGVEVLLDAAKLLDDRGCPVRLKMVGRFQFPDYEQEMRSYVARLGIESLVEWVGFTRDVAGELTQMDLFVLPSVLAEGLPMTVIEAMAAGVPAVGTRVAGTLDTIRHGVDGVLVEPCSAEELADAFADFANGKWNWREMREAAYRQQVARFSDRSMAAGVAEIYEQILASRAERTKTIQQTGATPSPAKT